MHFDDAMPFLGFLNRSIVLAAAMLTIVPTAPSASAHVDPPTPGQPTLVSPAMDEVVPPDPDGVPVVFKCPGFRESHGLGNFRVLVSTTGDVDESGLFTRDPNRTLDARADDIAFDGVDTCRTSVHTRPLGQGLFGNYLRPELSGGRLFWQVWTTEEVLTPVRGFTISPPQEQVGSLRVPKRAYAGHEAVFTYRTNLETFGATATLEQLSGDVWTPVVSQEFRGGRPHFIVPLGRGTTSVRVTLGLPSGPLSTQPMTLHVRRAKHWRTNARNDGRYRIKRFGGGFLSAAHVSARVSHKGRIIRSMRLRATGLCVSFAEEAPNPWIKARLRRIRIAPDGRFAAVVSDPKTGTDGEVIGKVTPGQIRMRLSVDKPGCSAFGRVVLRKRSGASG